MMHIVYDEPSMELTIDGHAGYAPAGQDIVCAGVSALIMAMVDTFETDEIPYSMEHSNGYIHLRCLDFSMESGYLFHSVCIGLEHIASIYPDFIKIGGNNNG